MSDLIEKVAFALVDAEGNIMDEARAAIAVVLKYLAKEFPESGIPASVARENGVSLND